MRRKCDFKRLISHFDMNVFPRVVWIFSQLTAFVLKLEQKNLRGRNLLYGELPMYLNIYLLEYGLLYLAVNFFSIFRKYEGVFHRNGIPICVFINIMNNNVKLRYRELRACFVFVNHTRNVFFINIGMCCLCLFFFRKL